jgi:hypothetical protein
LAGISAHLEGTDRLGTQAIRNACATYLTTTRYTRVTMYPKGGVAR